MTGDIQAPVPAALPFWLRPESILGRSSLTTFIERSYKLALPSTLAPYRLMLADASSPHGWDAPLRGGIRCRRAYYPLRVRVMGHPVTPPFGA